MGLGFRVEDLGGLGFRVEVLGGLGDLWDYRV